MLCVVLLSISTAFAADDVADDVIAVDDEITIDEPLSVEEDDSTVSVDGPTTTDVVTKDTFKNYFDEDGTLLSNVTSQELTFKGEIADVGVDTIVLDRPIKVIGDNATIKNIAIGVKANNVTISSLTLVQNNGSVAISVSNASDVVIENNNIDFKAIVDADGFAINADLADHLNLLNNVITYTGTTNGTGINNGIRVSDSLGSAIRGNKFKLNLVSSYVPWDAYWVSHPVSEGIVIDSSESTGFENNTVEVNYATVVGAYDTIYAINFKNSDYAMISGNNITANGHTYIYGIQMSGENFNINNNNIIVESDNYYANGIDIEGPASGVVDSNVISAKGVQLSYPIYSGMNGKNVSGYYIDNNISGEAYFVLGMSLGDVDSNIINNSVDLKGNYTTGIAYRGSELIVNGTRIILDSSEEGNESIWENFGVETVGIKVIMGNATIDNNVIAGPGMGISLAGDKTEAVLSNNFINVVGNVDKDAFAIYVTDVSGLRVNSNNIDYQGTTNGTGINNAVYLNNALDARFEGNDFTLELVSAYVPWIEEPAGSWNYVAHPISEGIVFEDSEAVQFTNNNVNVTYGDVVGAYDTIYAINFKNSDHAVTSGNNITANGHTYIYGIQISGENFNINNNNIIVESDNYYANGIDIEGPASGVVDSNVISAKGVQLSYPIYSGMNYQKVIGYYVDNEISGEAYFVLGMSLGDVESDIINNTLVLKGNYTTGIASNGDNLTIQGNLISAYGTNVGTEEIWETFGVETVGIKVTKGVANITDNTIFTSGDYTLDVKNDESVIENNTLTVAKTGESTVKNQILKTVISAPILYTQYVDGVVFPVVLLDENGDPVANKVISAIIDGVTCNSTPTDENGYTAFVPDLNAGSYDVVLSFNGDKHYAAKFATSMIVVDQSASEIIAPASKSVFLTAVKSGSYVTLTLKDMNDNGLAKKKVKITFNKKTKEYTTSELGVIKFKLSATKTGTYTLKMSFAGDNNYVGSSASTTVKITKQATKLTAANKAFKAKTKTKKYTVTLKDNKGKAIKKAKVTIKIGKKTYKATTNSKGKATFKITKLTKKGTYKSTVKFAGNAYYKAVKKSVKITVKK